MSIFSLVFVVACLLRNPPVLFFPVCFVSSFHMPLLQPRFCNVGCWLTCLLKRSTFFNEIRKRFYPFFTTKQNCPKTACSLVSSREQLICLSVLRLQRVLYIQQLIGIRLHHVNENHSKAILK
ncbi:hypothetical protein F5879DRAFT_538980 [Lentinula edodes]|nr:hypothetical protein F5879DRAFT_538980 [Lentinula edodes]